MPLPSNPAEHPTPAQVYELAVDYATLLRALFYEPGFKFLQKPTAEVSAVDPANTHKGLYWVTEFVQTTYVNHVIPFLPSQATRKTKELSNPWAHADPNYHWELTWDAEAGALKDQSGNPATFPTLSEQDVKTKMTDLVTRSVLIRKLIFNNGTDFMAQLALGGQTYDFNQEVKTAVNKIPG